MKYNLSYPKSYLNYYFLLILLTSANLDLFAAAADEKAVESSEGYGRKIYVGPHAAFANSDPEALEKEIAMMQTRPFDRRERIGSKISKRDEAGLSIVFKLAPFPENLTHPTTARQRTELARAEAKRLACIDIAYEHGFKNEYTVTDDGHSVLQHVIDTFGDFPSSRVKFLSSLLQHGATLPSELVGDPIICAAMKQAKIEAERATEAADEKARVRAIRKVTSTAIAAVRLAETGAVGADAGTPDTAAPAHSSFRVSPASAK